MIKINLQKLMEEKNIPNVNALAIATGIPTPTLYPICKNRVTRLNFETLETLCNFFDCGLEDLVTFKSESVKSPPKISDKEILDKTIFVKSFPNWKTLLKELPQHQQLIVKAYYGLENYTSITLQQIADLMEVSRQYVHQELNKAEKRLKKLEKFLAQVGDPTLLGDIEAS